MGSLGDLISAIRDGYWLFQEGRLAWMIRFIRHRYFHRLCALQSGLQLNQRGEGNLWNLRRNIHRLEKGLLHKQLRPVFGEDYILETVEYLLETKSSPFFDQNTTIWGESVLEQYFRTCQHTPRIEKAFQRFEAAKSASVQCGWYPYPAQDRPPLTIDYEALYQLARRRRSIRFFDDTPVDFELVERAMRVAALSPSACNRQCFKFLFYNEKDIVREISKIPGGFTGFELPAVVVVVASYRGYFDERDINSPLLDASMAAMSFLFALETVGLSSVCISWPALPDRDESISRLINFEDDEVIVMLIGLGFADPQGRVPYSAKRDIRRLIGCNERLKRTS